MYLNILRKEILRLERIIAVKRKDGLDFDNFYVSINEQGKYDVFSKPEKIFITSAETLKKAAQKAKLLQIGYNKGYSERESMLMQIYE